LKFEIDTTEISKITEKLTSIQFKASDLQPASGGIKLIIQEDVDFRFQNAPATVTGGESWGGEYWDKLSDRYLEGHPYRLGGQILRDTGELQQSLTIEGHPYETWSVSESELVFGSALAKAGFLQKKRPFIYWHPVLLEKVADFLVKFLIN
jgi:hypothetical protein